MRARFDGECQFHVPRYDAESLAAMQNTGRFWPAWFASLVPYKDYVKVHWACTLPLFYGGAHAWRTFYDNSLSL